MTCTNCSAEVTHNFCPNCGQPALLKRVDGHYIIHEIEHVLHFERGILYTIRELIIRPGQNVRAYLTENRNRLVKPIIFIIVTSLIYSLIVHFFHIEDKYIKYDEANPSAAGIFLQWMQKHYGYANIMMGVLIAFWTKLFFKKYKYNFFEILILLCFIMGIGMLIFAFFALLQGITHLPLMEIASYTSIVYCVWGMGQFFDKKKLVNYVKAFIAYLLGAATFFVLVFASAAMIDPLLKHG